MRRSDGRMNTAVVVAFLWIAAAGASASSRRTTLDTGSADRFLTVGGLRIHYLEWGSVDRPPMVLLHGIAKVAHSFDHLAPRLAPKYHVIAMDLRGHGDSDWSSEGAYLVEDYVKDLEGLIDQLRLHKPVLLGNSTGGRVAQVYAGMHPDRVQALIVEDVGPERPADVADAFARRVKAEANGWASEDELVSSLRASDKRTPEPILRNYAHFATKRTDTGRLVWKRDPNLVKGFVPTELWPYVQKISCPTLFVIGGLSSIVPPATQERLKETLPKARVVVMPGVGHYPNEEATDTYLTIVTDFLQNLSMTGQ